MEEVSNPASCLVELVHWHKVHQSSRKISNLRIPLREERSKITPFLPQVHLKGLTNGETQTQLRLTRLKQFQFLNWVRKLLHWTVKWSDVWRSICRGHKGLVQALIYWEKRWTKWRWSQRERRRESRCYVRHQLLDAAVLWTITVEYCMMSILDPMKRS